MRRKLSANYSFKELSNLKLLVNEDGDNAYFIDAPRKLATALKHNQIRKNPLLICFYEANLNGLENFRSLDYDKHESKDSPSDHVNFNGYIINKTLYVQLSDLISADV